MLPENIKKNFPILNREINGKELVYLDSAATSQKPIKVLNVMQAYYQLSNANVHRGIHSLAEEATQLFENARDKIASFVGIEDARQLIFTRNTTESINLVAKTWGVQNLKAGDLVLATEMEHHSNIVPWFMLREEKHVQVEFIRITEDGRLDLDHYAELLARGPKLVAFTHMSNVLGVINPAKSIIEAAHKIGATTLIDGAQSVPHMAVDITDLDADFYAFSAHKMCGPTGIGALFGKKVILDATQPFMGGGDMIKKVTFDGYSTNAIPYKFEAGTPSIAEAIGFGAAIDFLNDVGMEAIAEHEEGLVAYAYNALSNLDEVKIVGPAANFRGGVFSVTIDGIHPHDVAQILDQYGIAVRAGHHCAMPLHQKLDIPASTRASFYLYNSKSDVDTLIEGIKKVIQVFN